MATSGTFTGSRGGNSVGPWLELDWARQQIDIPNNRSLIRLTLRLHSSNSLYFSAGKSGNLHGSSFTYTGGFSGTGSKVLRTRDVWVNHNADGSKSQSFSASFNIAVSWSGSTLSSISVSGVADITAIPRASTLSAFSFASNLKPSTAVNLNYTIDRKSTAFRHQIQLRDGTHVVQTWDNVDANGASTVQLSSANVNSLLSRMSSVTSRSLTLRVATRSGVGGGWIGSAVTRNATATVDATVKPTVSALTVSQTGNSVSAHYLQGKSKVTGKFTRTAVGGATIASSSITVRRKTTNTDVQTINSNDGTTGKTVGLTGTYEAQGTARDSRGRVTNTAWAEFTVTAYASPVITNFTAVRNATTPTTVNIARAGTHSHLGGSNVLTYTVQRRIGTGSWTNVNTNATGTSITASFTGSSTSTGNSVTSSYQFRMVITDKFGESAESIITVSTQRVVLDIHKNEGVGIGKIHERGELDVAGEVFIDNYNISEPLTSPNLLRNSSFENGTENWVSETGGTFSVDNKILRVSTPVAGRRFYYDTVPKAIGTQVTATFYSRVTSGTHKLEVVQGQRQYILGEVTLDTEWQRHSVTFNYAIEYTLSFALMSANVEYQFRNIKLEFGSRATPWTPKEIGMDDGNNENGRFIKYADGTLICWNSNMSVTQITADTMRGDWTYPHKFNEEPVLLASMYGDFHGDASALLKGEIGIHDRAGNDFGIARLNLRTGAGTIKSGLTWKVSVLAIGRWG